MPPRVAVCGAGSMGLFVGSLLGHGGANVTLVGRARVETMLRKAGGSLSVRVFGAGARLVRITLPSDASEPTTVPSLSAAAAPRIRFITSSANVLAEHDVVILACKAGDTRGLLDELKAGLRAAGAAPRCKTIITLQNGAFMTNRIRIWLQMPEIEVLQATVTTNVVLSDSSSSASSSSSSSSSSASASSSPLDLFQATRGPIVFERSGSSGSEFVIDTLAAVPSLWVERVTDIRSVVFTKVLWNLNNAVNALSGLPLLEQLQHARLREIFLACLLEAMTVFAAEGISLCALGALPHPSRSVFLFSLPYPIYRFLFPFLFKLMPNARSSMHDDFVAGRRTEIDEFQGLVVRLAKKHGLAAPVCEQVQRLVHAHTTAGASTLDALTLWTATVGSPGAVSTRKRMHDARLPFTAAVLCLLAVLLAVGVHFARTFLAALLPF